MPLSCWVAVTKCATYEEQEVAAAVEKAVELIGGWDSFVSQGDRVLLKPNLLAPRPPQAAVTTHPAVVRAVAQQLLARGVQVQVGDSSGGVIAGRFPTARSFTVSGIEKVCRELGLEMINFDIAGTVRVAVRNGGFLSEVEVARPLLEVDAIINLPKLKTHTATLFTGAVKNLFGLVPGTRKAYYHRQAARAEEFSSVLVDIFQTFPPRLNVMDAVVGMEGNGPGAGSPRQIGLLLAGGNAVLVDAVACRVIGLDPYRVRYLREAERRKLCPSFSDVELKFTEVITFPVVPGFKLPSNFWFEVKPAGLTQQLMARLKYRPVCRGEKCTGCRICADSCPAQAITWEEGGEGGRQGKMVIDVERCIECLCCQELCPQGAIEMEPVSWLGKIVGKIMEKER